MILNGLTLQDLPHASDGSESSEGEASEGSGDTVESSDALQLVCPQEVSQWAQSRAGSLTNRCQGPAFLNERLN